MTHLETSANKLRDPDEAYRMIIEAHRGLSDAESADLNARLVLILINQLGDEDVLRRVLDMATAKRES